MNRLSRRQMLLDSMFAAAATAAAGFVAPPAVQAQQRRVGPNDKLRVAILGVNNRGQTHIANFVRRPDCDIVAVVDPDESVGRTKGVEVVQQKQGTAPRYYRDLRQAIGDANVDVIAIATPNHWHSLATIWAVQAGKDVYCEKPVSHSVEEGRRASEWVEQTGRVVACGTQSRSHEAHQQAMKFLHDGGIGTVKLARGLCYKRRKSIGPRSNYDVPASVDYDLYLGPAAAEPLTRNQFHYDWHWQWNCGNGDLGNQGIHQMDIARWGLGLDNLGKRVMTFGGRLGYEDAGETPNTEVSIYDFPGGQRIIFETRGLEIKDDGFHRQFGKEHGNQIGVIFEGADGYLVSTSNFNHVTAFDPDGNSVRTFEGGSTEDHFDNFVEAVKARDVSQLNSPFVEGHLSSALCHLGNISYRLGSKLPVGEIGAGLQDDGQALDALERTLVHLRENGVDVDRQALVLGPDLTVDGQAEVFTGFRAADANSYLFREGREQIRHPLPDHLRSCPRGFVR